VKALDASHEVESDFAGSARPARRRRRRRQPAPKANPFWRFVFPLLVVGAGVAVLALWREGTKSVLDSTDGREIELVIDPAEPGYEAFVDPTPTLLVAHTEGEELVGVTVLAQTALEAGGSGVLLSAHLLVVHEGGDSEDVPEFLAAAWADGGLESLEILVERMFGFGFTETIELDIDGLAGLLGLVEPLPYLLSDDLVTENADGSVTVWLDQGRKELDGEDAAQVYGFRNPGEPDASRVLRQLRLWDAWLESIARSDDPLAATLPFEEGLSPFLRSLGVGAEDIVILPMEPVGLDPDDPPFYILESVNGDGWLRDRALDMVPLPISPKSAVRATVRLLDGTGDAANRDRSSSEIVAAGGVITVIGNAKSFGVSRTTVLYHRPEVVEQAKMVAESLSVEAVFVDDVEQPTDLTVTIGLDRVAS
jgi:hypothetical protein